MNWKKELKEILFKKKWWKRIVNYGDYLKVRNLIERLLQEMEEKARGILDNFIQETEKKYREIYDRARRKGWGEGFTEGFKKGLKMGIRVNLEQAFKKGSKLTKPKRNGKSN